MKTITLADTADEYHGYDHVLGLDIDLAGDELAEVAPEMRRSPMSRPAVNGPGLRSALGVEP